jgi:hypothetical protein
MPIKDRPWDSPLNSRTAFRSALLWQTNPMYKVLDARV